MKFVYYCDKNINRIDVYPKSDKLNNEYETFNENVAISYAKKYNIPFIGYDIETVKEAKRLNSKAGNNFKLDFILSLPVSL